MALDLYLRQVPSDANPNDLRLWDPSVFGGGFPTQFPGLRFYDNGAVQSLCLVATADAPVGDMPRIYKGGVAYAIYLVDTTDPSASTVRLRTNDGTKSIRLLT